MRQAYSYIRFSTPEQLKGDSLRRQKEWSEKYCKDHGLHLVPISDLGVSAFRGKHRKNKKTDGLAEFCRLAETGKIPSGSVLSQASR